MTSIYDLINKNKSGNLKDETKTENTRKAIEEVAIDNAQSSSNVSSNIKSKPFKLGIGKTIPEIKPV